jgi:CRP-like cAMP-binding protein
MAQDSCGNGAFKNAILAKLPRETLKALAPRPLDLTVNLVLYEPNEVFEYVYFPERGVLSIVALHKNGNSIEVGTVGHEGMIGSTLLLNTDTSPYRHFVQVEGYGHRVGASRFKQIAESDDQLRNAVLSYEASFRIQTMQGIACNGLHNVEQRCCRWLLMTRDRVESDDLKLTHEFLGLMLGVRRASVTEVLGPLQTAGLVTSNRGTISILDRSGLERRVCDCYWVITGRERTP